MNQSYFNSYICPVATELGTAVIEFSPNRIKDSPYKVTCTLNIYLFNGLIVKLYEMDFQVGGRTSLRAFSAGYREEKLHGGHRSFLGKKDNTNWFFSFSQP